MTSVCLYFKVHQPYRLKDYKYGDIGVSHCYEDADTNKELINEVADNCYLPANEILFNAIKNHQGRFKISFSISGTTLELLQQYRPDVINSFKKLVDTGCVELLTETYYHSYSFLFSKKEFRRQINKHSALVEEIFGITPTIFRNTELIYNNELARLISGLGFKGLLCEGMERILKGRTANQLYAAPYNGDFGLLLRNTSLSDDIAFRYGDANWCQHPLTAEKYANWLHAHPENTEVINLFMDYETFGIHKKKESGILNFLEALPDFVLANNHFQFSTPSSVLDEYYPKDIYNVPKTVSWEGKPDFNLLGSNRIKQDNLLKKLYSIERMVNTYSCNKAIDCWGKLQSADHLYFTGEKQTENDNIKHENIFPDEEEAFQNYNNILIDFEISLIKANIEYRKINSTLNISAFILY